MLSQIVAQYDYLYSTRHALRFDVRWLRSIWERLVGPSHGPAAATFSAPVIKNPVPTNDTSFELFAHSSRTSQSGASRITAKMYAGESQIR